MKNITHASNVVAEAVRCKNGGELSKLINKHNVDNHERGVSDDQRNKVEGMVDLLFIRLRQAFPASVAAFKNPEVEEETKKQWVITFIREGIVNQKQFAAGVRHAFRADSPYWPSVGQFIAWCREGELEESGLPNIEELEREVMKYNGEKHFIDDPTQYPWPSPAVYWMVIDLSARQHRHQWDYKSLRKACEEELKKMAKRIVSGEKIPEPRVAIASKTEYRPAERESVLKHIAGMKEMLKARRRG